MNRQLVHDAATACGFDLVGVTRAHPTPDFTRFRSWVDRGLAGEMRYLTDHRAGIRNDPEQMLPGLRSIICVGLVYNGPEPRSTEFSDIECAWISRYAWGEDYHRILRDRLEDLARKLSGIEKFAWRVCVDTAPLLERSLAAQAGLGWIGRNTCLINQRLGSWFFLGELLTTLDIESDSTLPDRCGTCTRCIEACPTQALVSSPDGRFELDARLCISYFTIELRNSIPEEHRPAMGTNIFGCDICQDVCPWNRKAAFAASTEFRPLEFAPALERLADLSEIEFRDLFRRTPIPRAKYEGFLRNVAVAMGNTHLQKFREPLEKLAVSPYPVVADHAQWALRQLNASE